MGWGVHGHVLVGVGGGAWGVGLGRRVCLLPEVFALTRELAHRVLGMRPFDVQVLAGVAIHRGRLVEMLTGEGKTLAAVLPATLRALGGQGVHVLTFNDYLARRDARWMGPVFEAMGLSVGTIQEWMEKEARRRAYTADVTCGTAKEVGFDFLRASLARSEEDLVQQPFNGLVLAEVNQALHARVLLRRDVDYIVRDERIEIVDEFTGRVVADRRWPDGLHRSLEAKEGLAPMPASRILGSITLHHLDEFWARHLELVGEVREWIHLVGLGGKNPLHEFHRHIVPPIRAHLAE